MTPNGLTIDDAHRGECSQLPHTKPRPMRTPKSSMVYSAMMVAVRETESCYCERLVTQMPNQPMERLVYEPRTNFNAKHSLAVLMQVEVTTGSFQREKMHTGVRRTRHVCVSWLQKNLLCGVAVRGVDLKMLSKRALSNDQHILTECFFLASSRVSDARNRTTSMTLSCLTQRCFSEETTWAQQRRGQKHTQCVPCRLHRPVRGSKLCNVRLVAWWNHKAMCRIILCMNLVQRRWLLLVSTSRGGARDEDAECWHRKYDGCLLHKFT